MPPQGTSRGRRPPSSVAAAAVVAVLLAAGCSAGGGGQGSAAGTDDPTTSTTAPEPTVRASAGCDAGEVVEPVVEAERTLTVGDEARRYLLTVPDEHDGGEPLPVVLDFHGLREGAEIHAQMTQYSALAEEEGFVVVFPHGTGDPVHWRTDPALDPNPDLAYVDALLDDVTSTLCLDESRIYATGLSNGAMFTSLLVCERADVLAAAAPVAGIMDVEGCDQAEPVPITTYHGTADPILLFNGGVDLSAIPGGEGEAGGEATTSTTRPPADLDGEGYPATVDAFAERNGCEPEPTDTDVSEEVVRRVYDCPEGADVEFSIVEGGGHSWPSSDFSASIADIVGPTTFDVDATADGWAFLRRFTDR